MCSSAAASQWFIRGSDMHTEKQLSKRMEAYFFVVVLTITAFGFGQTAGQSEPLDTVARAADPPEPAPAPVIRPSVSPKPAPRAEQPVGIAYGTDERFRSEGYNNADLNGAKQ